MYCVHVWGSAYETHLRHLMTLQNKIVKLIAEQMQTHFMSN